MAKIFHHYRVSVSFPQSCGEKGLACVTLPNTLYCARCFEDHRGHYPCLAMNLNDADKDHFLRTLDGAGAWPLVFTRERGGMYDIFGVTEEMRERAAAFLSSSGPTAAINPREQSEYPSAMAGSVGQRFIPEKDAIEMVNGGRLLVGPRGAPPPVGARPPTRSYQDPDEIYEKEVIERGIRAGHMRALDRKAKEIKDSVRLMLEGAPRLGLHSPRPGWTSPITPLTPLEEPLLVDDPTGDDVCGYV